VPAAARGGGSRRALTTIAFVDIVGSTERAAAIGDVAWQALLSRYYALARADARRFHGRVVDTAGDGLFIAFDAPADGVRCAMALRDAVEELGLQVRAGLHIGEAEHVDGRVGGIAVHIGARIAATAEPGEVLVSNTVRDLMHGSGIVFEDRGVRELRGVPEPWHVYAATGASAQMASLPPNGLVPTSPVAFPRPQFAGRMLIALVAVLVALPVGALLVTSRPGSTAAPSPSSNASAIASAVAAATAIATPTTPTPTATTSPTISAGPASTPSAVPVTVAVDSVAKIDGSGRVVGATKVGALPDSMAVGFDSIWVTNTTDGTVTRLNADGSSMVPAIPVGSSPRGIVAAHDAIWVANSDDGKVSRIDPGTNRVVAQIPVGAAPTDLTADDRWVWVTNRLDGSVSRIDPASDRAATFSAGATPIGIGTAGGSIWVADYEAGELVRIDPSSGELQGRINVGNGPTSVATSADSIWVVNSLDGTVSQIDLVTQSQRAVIPVGDEPSAIMVDGGSVWVAIASTSELVRIDSATDTIAARTRIAGSPQAIVSDGSDLAVAVRAPESSHRGGTLKVVGTLGTFEDSIDPAHAFVATVGLLTNDGLVGFKRVGGPDGLTVVPDLAVAKPAPTNGGRTYVFKLRPGIVFSNGQPVTASDVKRSLERAVLGPFGFSMTDIVGAGACLGHKTCSLDNGVETDDAAGTVTINLVQADPDFLTALAGPDKSVLPAATPFEEATAPLVSTGPYVVKSFVPGQEITLVRNPRFHEWSPAAQPDGYPDEIDWTVIPSDQDPSALVESGAADWTPDTPSASRLSELETHRTSQLHVSPSLLTFFEFMNTHVAPFDNPDVRRAINYAVDRNALVAAYGGPLTARVTCQLVQSGYAGYEPYCPYTVGPDSNGTWRAPDLAQAKALIAHAGVAGTHVTVWGLDAPGHRDVAKAFARLLTQLGLPATVRLLPFDTFFADTGKPTTMQMSGFWFGNVSPSAADSVVGTFTCPGYTDTYQGYPMNFCDPAIDAMVTQALKLESTDRSAANRLWAKIDRSIVDAAPAVMAFNPTDVEFVSGRVGNYQHHPEFQILLDQLWVH
jgi:peptide/nickel transport system substrate-binding protein